MKRYVPAALVARLLRYEPETGKLFWRQRTPDMLEGLSRDGPTACKAFNQRSAGKEAMTAVRRGYRVGNIFSRTYSAHRVIWAIVTGDWPEGDVDHIDGDRTNNRLANLRDVSRQENLRNGGKLPSNSTGVTGVYRNTHTTKFSAKISVNNKSVHLGYFETIEAAAKARAEAEVRYGFSPRHGRRPAHVAAG